MMVAFIKIIEKYNRLIIYLWIVRKSINYEFTRSRMGIRVVRFATVFEFLTGDEICVTVSLKKLKSKKSRILNQI